MNRGNIEVLETFIHGQIRISKESGSGMNTLGIACLHGNTEGHGRMNCRSRLLLSLARVDVIIT